MKKTDYGIDAPGVIRNLFIFGIIGFLVANFVPVIHLGSMIINPSGFVWMGVCCTCMGFWMLLYSKYGKFKHRDRMLNMINWRGDEQVLDVGTGRGLMMIGVAKRLTTGKSVGIDIWSARDLTSNAMENTLSNADAEGVRNRVDVKSENATKMQFPDDTFDVIMSNLCIHNIEDVKEREQACSEISRVLKKGGIGIISDFKNMKEYKKNFEKQGLKTELLRGSYLLTFPPLSILKIVKL